MNYSHKKTDSEFHSKDTSISYIYTPENLPPHKRTSSFLESARSALYRYEGGGIIVYDSHARISDQQGLTSFTGFESRNITREVKKQIEKAGEYGMCYLDKMQYLKMPCYTPCKQVPIEYTLVIPSESCLRFDSRFESGNLRKAVMVSECEYDLYLEYDLETQGHTQWYYFNVESYKQNHRVRLNIVNLMKYESLYNNGLKPVIFSKKDSHLGWHRSCESVSYYQNSNPRKIVNPKSKLPQFYYTLTFTYEFKHERDTVSFAHCYPYTYTQLNNFLQSHSSNPSNLNILRVDSLCETIAGNICPVLTITQNVHTLTNWDDEIKLFEKSSAARRLERQKKERFEAKMRLIEKFKSEKFVRKNYVDMSEHAYKRGIVFTARVHPGESNASYIMQGLINFLLGESREAKTLRRNFIFRIVPMLNPDGVIYGNYRCSLLGVDLNRRWMNPNKVLHPTIYYTKKLIQAFSEEREVIFYCDMHGHSMKRNVFMYACYSKSQEIESKQANVLIKLIPFLFSERNKLFSFKESRFRLERSKESTARVVIFKEFGILNSYTLEASFFGPTHSAALENKDPSDEEPSTDCHMLPRHLEGLGRDLCKLLMIFTSSRYFRKKLREVSALMNRSPKLSTLKKVSSVATVDLSNSLRMLRKDFTDAPDDNTAFKIPGESVVLGSEEVYDNNERNEWGEDSQFVLSDVIADIKPELLDDLEIEEILSDSGGSDSCPSDNDDRRQAYLNVKEEIKTRRKRKRSNKRYATRSESVAKHNCVKSMIFSQCKFPPAESPTKLDLNTKDPKLPEIKESNNRACSRRSENISKPSNVPHSKSQSPYKPDFEDSNPQRNSINQISATQASNSSPSPARCQNVVQNKPSYFIKPISILPFSKQTSRADTSLGHKPRRPRLTYRAITPHIDKKPGVSLMNDILASMILKRAQTDNT
jgi:hypothetical protein